jgi:hydrogenase nickel incorporation protein HypA/HybF
MHEMGIVLRILSIAREAVPREMGEVRVEAVNVRVGRLAGVSPESLSFCFEAARENTPLEGARLVIEEVPVEAACLDCGAVFAVEDPRFACRQCGGVRVEVLSGRELSVTSIEIADP